MGVKRTVRIQRAAHHVHHRCDDLAMQLALHITLRRADVQSWPCNFHGICLSVEPEHEMALFRVSTLSETRRLRMYLIPWMIEMGLHNSAPEQMRLDGGGDE